MFILFRDFNVNRCSNARLILPIPLPAVKKSIRVAFSSFHTFASFIFDIGDKRMVSDAALATVDTMWFDKVTHLNDIVIRLLICAHLSLARISHETTSGSRLICQSSSSNFASPKVAVLSSPFCDMIAGRSRHNAAAVYVSRPGTRLWKVCISWKARPQLWLLLRSNLVRSKCSSNDCSSANRSSSVFAESANLAKSQSRSGSTTSATSIISLHDLERWELASSRSSGKSTEWQLVLLLVVVAEMLLALLDRTSITPPLLRRSSGKPRWWWLLWCDASGSGWSSSMCESKRGVGGKM